MTFCDCVSMSASSKCIYSVAAALQKKKHLCFRAVKATSVDEGVLLLTYNKAELIYACKATDKLTIPNSIKHQSGLHPTENDNSRYIDARRVRTHAEPGNAETLLPDHADVGALISWQR